MRTDIIKKVTGIKMSEQQKTKLEPATSRLDLKETEAGSVFVSNYPPYSFWNEDDVVKANSALNRAPEFQNTLGLYVHIPFCRKRCKFCYFRVYTDKNSQQIEDYLTAVKNEVAIYAGLPSVAGRPLKFVYFGGGTPSYISVKHLKDLTRHLKSSISWQNAEEVTFECEPGTLSQSKLEAIREIGVTRLSLGIENFNDSILAENGRAHLSKEIYQVLPWIKELGFAQLNIDLIAGMVGETWQTWRENVSRTMETEPDSVTIYQMELPVFTRMLSEQSQGEPLHVADWQTKREWHKYAIEQLTQAGYQISSAYTMVNKDKPAKFVYRDSVWRGSDMIGAGVASFSHMQHVHFQNSSSWDDYLGTLAQGQLPVKRAFATSAEQRQVRELILQMKLGELDTSYFSKKFGVDVLTRHKKAFKKLESQGMLSTKNGKVMLSSQGLLRVDQILPEFYDEMYQNARYS
jgi:oxygen-independent coproporphyrinogen-3 oxidase